MTILQIILVATHILMITVGYQMGKQDGYIAGIADEYKAAQNR